MDGKTQVLVETLNAQIAKARSEYTELELRHAVVSKDLDDHFALTLKAINDHIKCMVISVALMIFLVLAVVFTNEVPGWLVWYGIVALYACDMYCRHKLEALDRKKKVLWTSFYELSNNMTNLILEVACSITSVRPELVPSVRQTTITMN